MCPSAANAPHRSYLTRLILGVVALLILAIPAQIHSTAAIKTLRNLPAEWLPLTLPLRQDFIRFEDRFGVTDIVLVSWAGSDSSGAQLEDGSIRAAVDLLRPLTLEAKGDQSSNTVKLGDNSDSPKVRQFQAAVRQLCDDPSPIDWVRSGTEIRDGLRAAPLNLSKRMATRRLLGTLVGPDGKQTCLMVSLGKSTGPHQRILLPMIREAIAEVTGVHLDQVAMVGGPVDGAAIDGEAIRSIERYSLASSALAALFCWLCLRSVAMTLSVVGVATIGQGMSLALVYYAGITMNAVLIVLPPLVFVLTVSSGIHLCNYYLDEIRELALPESPATIATANKAIAAKAAMRHGVPPCLFATFTTVVGLSSLALVRLEPVRVFGLVGSVSILGTLALLFLILPGAMVVAKVKPAGKPSSTDLKGKQDGGIGNAILLWRRWIIAGFAIVAAVVSVGMGSLQTSVQITGMFYPKSSMRQQYDWFEQNVGATMSGDVLLSFPSSAAEASAAPETSEATETREAVKTSEATETREATEASAAAAKRSLAESKAASLEELRSVIAVHSAIQKIPGVGGVMSSASFLPIPSTTGGLSAVARRAAIGSQLSDPNSEVYRLGYVDQGDHDRTWRISLRLFQTDGADPGSLIPKIESSTNQAIDDQIAASSADNLTVRPTVTTTGHIVIVERTQELLLRDLFNSFMAALMVISMCMVAFLRSFVGGILSMIPNVIPTLLLFGTMGWLRSPLDIGSIMTASVALGIAVDDTVHLLARFRHHYELVGDRRQASLLSLQLCGWAMLQTTVVCSLSMLVYALSDFVPTRHFALFMLGLLTVAWLGVATLLPAMLSTRLGKFFAKRVAN